jgi:hypothetical protein
MEGGMDVHPYIRLGCAAILLMSLTITGCGVYGKLQPADPSATLSELVRNWRDYDVYYAGPRRENPSAILFDPRGDDRSIASNGWTLVKGEEEISRLVASIGSNVRRPRLQNILGPDGQVYGLVYSTRDFLEIRLLEPNRVYVEAPALPPISYGP